MTGQPINLARLKARPSVYDLSAEGLESVPLTPSELDALVEAAEAAQRYIEADDRDPRLAEFFQAWLDAQARFDFHPPAGDTT